MNRIHNPGGPPIDPRIGRTGPVERPSQRQDDLSKAGNPAFKEIFQRELRTEPSLRFSAHAQDRLTSRHIQLTSETVERLAKAVDRAAAKGARDALLLMPGASRGEDLALVVSVANRTVITAVDGEHMRENVFTNIDSAIIVSGKEENPQTVR